MKRRIAFAPMLLLAACGQPASNGSGEQADKQTETPAPAPVATPEVPSDATPPLPIATGVYVIEGSSCTAPANAAFRIYDGEGISGSATRDCRLEQTRREEDRYSFDQSCTDTYSGERSSYPIEVEVTGPDSFTLSDGDETTRFVHCADEDVPDYLKG